MLLYNTHHVFLFMKKKCDRKPGESLLFLERGGNWRTGWKRCAETAWAGTTARIVALLWRYNIRLKSKAVISEDDLRRVKSIDFQACLRFLIPQMREATRLRSAVSRLWWMDLMSDPSLPALPVSNDSFHASRLPADWSLWSRCDCLFLRFGFKRRQAFRGCARICSSTSSSPPLPPVLSLCSSFQVFPGVSESLSSLLFLSSRDRWEQTAWQFSLFFLSSSLSSFPCGAALSVFPCHAASTFSKLSWEKALINHFEGAKSALVYFYQQTRSLVDLDRLQLSSTNTQIKIYTLYFAAHTHTHTHTTRARARKHIQHSNLAKFPRQFDGSVALLLL